MNNTQELIQKFLQYLSQRDLTKLTSLFAKKIDWYIPGNEAKAAWLGKRTTQQEVQAFYELLWSNTEPVSAAVDHIFIDGDNAVITGEFSTKMLQTGKVINSLFSIRIGVKDGLIVQYKLLEDSYAVSEALS
jgi:ketosteroid isomerase-like protein